MAQATYGTSRYDDRTGELIVMTTEFKASGHYRYNWTHFVNPETGEIMKTIELEPYYWFQSMPIFPDKEDARLAEDFKGISIVVDDENSMQEASAALDLRDVVSDPDNNDHIIIYTLPEASAQAEYGESTPNLSLENGRLTVKPTGYGHTTALVNATSNGRTVTLSIPVDIVKNSPTGIDGINTGRSIRFVDNRLIIKGCSGESFSLYDTAGIEMNRFTVDADEFRAAFNLKPGVYVLRGADTSFKFIVR